jgi:SAM-dependent methyltransferase
VSEDFCCAVCRGPASKPFLAQCRDLYLRKSFIVEYVECVSCNLVQQHPMPDDVSEFYEAYPIHQTKPGVYSWVRRRLLSKVYVAPRKWPPGAHLLDFGCGDGWYLRWCKEQGLRPIGFESSEAHARAIGSAIGIETLWSLDDLERRFEGTFDVITIHFVVEHLTDFVGTITRLSRLLRKGGIVRYVVPNIRSWEFRLFGRKWHGLDPPRHVIFPTREHAVHVARKVGLEFIDERATSFPNGFAGSVSTALGGTFSRPLFWIVFPLSLVVTRLLPSGNVAYSLRRPAH